MNKLLLFSFVITCCLVGFAHSTGCAQQNYTVTPGSGVNTLNLALDSAYDYTYNYYYTTGSQVQASVVVCAGDSGVATPSVSLTSGASGVVLTIKPTDPSTTPGPSVTASTQMPSTLPPPSTVKNAAGRMTFSPLAAVMSICLACVFAFPKQRFSMFVVFVVLALAFCAPVSQAEKASRTSITINIGIPASISSVCVNGAGNCVSIPSFPYVVSLNNKVFTTLDQASACTNGQAMNIPNGWEIASASDEAKLVIVFNSWTAQLIFTQGSTLYTNNDQTLTVSSDGGQYTNVGQTVSVTDCTKYKVLITASASNSFPIDPSKALISTSLSFTNFVTFQGYDFAVADNTPFGTTTRTSQTSAIYVQTSDVWQVAQYSTTSGTAEVAVLSQTNSFGSECVAMQYNGAYTSFSATNFSSCGSTSVITRAYGSGTVFGLARGSSYTTKMLMSRVTPQVGTLDSWNTMPVISETYTLGGVMYAMLDNAPVSTASSSACQGRFFAPPTSDWYYASDAQLSALVSDLATSNKWPNTQCFSNGANSTSRSGVAGCAGSSIVSTGLNLNFRTSSSCARIVIVHAPQTQTFNIGLKIAIITFNGPSDGVVSLATSMLDARQIPYDVFTTSSSTTTLALTSGGNPLYYAIVLGESMAVSAPNDALKKVIADYRFAYDVRVVFLNAYPQATQGLIPLVPSGISSVTNNIYMDASFATSFAGDVDGVVPTSLFEIATKTAFYYPVNPGYNAVPFLRATALNSSVTSSSDYIVGALVTNTDGTEELQFYVSLNANTYTGPVMANVWISWVTRGLYLGYRRVYFSPQIDDLLLATGQFQNDNDERRMTGEDMRKTAEYFENVLAPTLPQGSYVTLTWGINGFGQKNFSSLGNPNNYTIDPTAGADDLADAILQYYDSFFWESHTFSHKDFTCSTEQDADNPSLSCNSYTTSDTIKTELAFNNRYFNEQLFKTVGGINAPRFSANCMITPAITGLVGLLSGGPGNPVSVDAIASQNYTCVVGDNTRPILIAPNPYDGLYTTNAVNGGTDGALFIIPRYATEIYFNTFDTYYLELQYNFRYGPQGYNATFDHNLTTNEILVREATANFWHMSALRHDPFMFHQCNNMHWNYTAMGDTVQKEWSLVTLWIKAVTEKYLTHMNLPLLTVKQQDLQNVYFARRARNSCNLAATIQVNNGVMGNVVVTGNNTCTPVITGLACPVGTSGCAVENYGPDVTSYITLPTSKTATVTFPGNTKW